MNRDDFTHFRDEAGIIQNCQNMKARDERRVDGTPTGIREARKSEQMASKMAGVHFINVRSGFFLTATLLARDLARALSSAAPLIYYHS